MKHKKKQHKLIKPLRLQRQSRIIAGFFVAAFSAVGIVLLVHSFAVTPYVQVEPEVTTVSGGATFGNDVSASGGRFINFVKQSVPTQSCASPLFSTSDPNGGWSNGGYYVHNNMWNTAEAGPETLFACSFSNWYVNSTQPATTSVKTYPNVHKDFNNLNGVPLSTYTTMTSTFAATSPRVGIYDVAYDIWLNGVGWGNGTTEIMIWTDNFKQVPLGTKDPAQVSFLGKVYDAYHYNDGNANVVSFLPTSVMTSGTLDIMAMIKWTIAKNWMPANPSINQLGFGVEICSTNNQPATFTFTDFSLTAN